MKTQEAARRPNSGPSRAPIQDVLARLGWQPRFHGQLPTAPKRRKNPARGAGKGSGAPNEARKRELERETRHWRELKAKWAKEVETADAEHDGFHHWLNTLEDEAKCDVPKPGIVDWDVTHEVRRLKLIDLPLPVRVLCLTQFTSYMRKVERRNGWTEADKPFPKSWGPAKDCYDTDWDRVKRELELV